VAIVQGSFHALLQAFPDQDLDPITVLDYIHKNIMVVGQFLTLLYTGKKYFLASLSLRSSGSSFRIFASAFILSPFVVIL